MSVSSVTSTPAAGTPSAAELAALNSASGAEGGQTTLGEGDFLQLLTTQLENQDPMNPVSDTQFISQMATFSQLSAQDTLNTNFSNYSASDAITSAQNYIGKMVSVSGAAEGDAATSGTVTGVVVNNGAPELTINGTNYSVSDVTGIQPASTSASTASASTTSTTSTTPTTATTTPASASAATTASTGS